MLFGRIRDEYTCSVKLARKFTRATLSVHLLRVTFNCKLFYGSHFKLRAGSSANALLRLRTDLDVRSKFD